MGILLQLKKKNNVYFTLIIIGFHNTNMQMGEYYENEHSVLKYTKIIFFNIIS